MSALQSAEESVELRRLRRRYLRERAARLEAEAIAESFTRGALRDSLTDLANGRLLDDRLQSALGRARRHESLLAVLYLDLDDFKEINDRFGHPTGDKLLQVVAERLRSVVRAVDTVARPGGDEFVIVVPDVESRSAVAQLAVRVATTVAQPVHIGGLRLVTVPSVGIGFSTGGDTPAEVLRDADAAMYRAKQRRGGFPQVPGPPAPAVELSTCAWPAVPTPPKLASVQTLTNGRAPR